jgi:hypothetical protein
VARGWATGAAAQAPTARRFDGAGLALRAERPREVWARDFRHNRGWARDSALNVVHEFTRKALAMLVARSIDIGPGGERARAPGGRSRRAGAIRCDNGPEPTGHALRDWCVFFKAGTAFIEHGLAVAEPVCGVLSFPRARRVLDCEGFAFLAEAQVLISARQGDYNWRLPHSSLG